MQVKKQQLELDMEQWTGSKLGKEYNKAVRKVQYVSIVSKYDKVMIIIVTLLILLIGRIHQEKCQVDKSQGVNKIDGKHININILRYEDGTMLMAENAVELKSLLMRVKAENDKAGLKVNI